MVSIPLVPQVQSLPDEKDSVTKDEWKARVAMCLGGQIGEELAFGKDKITGGRFVNIICLCTT